MGLFGKKKDTSGGDIPPIPGPPPGMEMGQGNGMAPGQPDMGYQDQGYDQQQDGYYQQQMTGQDFSQGQGIDQGMQPDMGYQDQGYGQQQDFSQNQGIDQGMQPEPQNVNAHTFPTPQFNSQNNPREERERIEEIAESIVDEKWNNLVKDINKVIEWKEKTDTEIKKVIQEVGHLKERFESLHTGVLGKISEYDQNLNNVGTEIKAMEKVFQNILPTFTENVGKLDRIVKGSKKGL